jgi:hypothetical protein
MDMKTPFTIRGIEKVFQRRFSLATRVQVLLKEAGAAGATRRSY